MLRPYTRAGRRLHVRQRSGRRFIGTLQPSGPVAEEVIPGGEGSRVPDQLPLWLTDHSHPWLYRPADVNRGTIPGEVIDP